jgi:ketosteroid isomerase-like protein
MRITSLAIIALLLNLAGCVSGARPTGSDSFMPDEIRAAERAVIAALESPDPTAWVYLYTEDAILLEPGEAPVQGREALLGMARSMKPLSSVTILAERTVGDGDLAYTYGKASWVNGRPPNAGATTNVRVVMIWRKEADGVSRVAQEVFVPDTQGK